MADSSANGLTSLARALSQPTLDLIEVNDVSPTRSLQLHPGRRRRLSSCNSIENGDLVTSPCGAEARVLVINTGGTIGMTLHDDVLAPKANAFVKSLRKLPILHDEMYAQQTRLYEYYGSENILVLPKPAPHPDLHFHGCCSTGCIVCDFTLPEIGLSVLSLAAPCLGVLPCWEVHAHVSFDSWRKYCLK